MSYRIEMQSPSTTTPCGFQLDIPYAVYSTLKSVGGETLVIKKCPKCEGEHRIPLNPLTDIVVELKPNIATMASPLLGNGRAGLGRN